MKRSLVNFYLSRGYCCENGDRVSKKDRKDQIIGYLHHMGNVYRHRVGYHHPHYCHPRHMYHVLSPLTLVIFKVYDSYLRWMPMTYDHRSHDEVNIDHITDNGHKRSSRRCLLHFIRSLFNKQNYCIGLRISVIFTIPSKNSFSSSFFHKHFFLPVKFSVLC